MEKVFVLHTNNVLHIKVILEFFPNIFVTFLKIENPFYKNEIIVYRTQYF